MKNNKIGIIKPYKKEHDYSYTLGAYATIEMIEARPEIVQRQTYFHLFSRMKRQVWTKTNSKISEQA